MLGAAISGVIGDLFGWRGVFAILGRFRCGGARWRSGSFRNRRSPTEAAFSRAAVIANFSGVFADPRAKVCFGAVFLEAIFIQGLFPYVALLLRRHRRDAGVGRRPPDRSFAVGGILYSLVVPYLVAAVPERRLMLIGGVIAAAGSL